MGGRRAGAWILPLVAAVVLGFSHWAWRIKPDSTLLASARAGQAATLSARNPNPTLHAHLLMDFRSGPAAVRWVLHEGPHPGGGYELHWLPERLALRLIQVGEEVRILGTAFLSNGPRYVEFLRQGLRLRVVADGREVLNVIDGLPTEAPRVWAWQAASDLGEVRLSLHDESGRADPAEEVLAGGDADALRALAHDEDARGTSIHALTRLRLALLADPAQAAAWEDAQRDARAALRALGDRHPDAAGIDAWLAWSHLRGALAVSGGSTYAVAAAADRLAERATVPGPAVELPGLLLDHLARLVIRSCHRPQRPVPVAEVLAQRRLLLSAAERLGVAALDREAAGLGTSDHERWMLRLMVHAIRALGGGVIAPTPADGPVWLAERWRAFAGRAPRSGHLPPPTPGWLERDPLGIALDQLVVLARFDPIPALGLTERITSALAADDGEAALAAIAAAPPEIARQAALAQAILALRGIGGTDEARAALARADTDGVPLAVDDPLGYALDRLIASGLRRTTRRDELVLPGVTPLPEPLRWAAPLLSGAAGSTVECWRLAPERPSEAIAAALIMQELAGALPDWSLLGGRPHFTVPLHLIAPSAPPPDREPAPRPEPQDPVLP